ncbi:hypothetical protein [Phyllobacterium leguminum]|uniref:Uncharacterized protein n=1 Tax=Phyllobacterium leguminum TaxID=314237 RepID=A0A318SUB3_9HYPH|nr:hypothetical protein [Phyllobacterium leguminum]PYE85263.1 hypothetical protein C7477_1338 [Phyllobacterium leguminum]
MSRASSATGLIALGGAAGLIISLIAYTSRSSGIDGAGGTLLVIFSCAAILLAALALTLWDTRRNWWTGTLIFLLLLGILGTAFAGYMLESQWLVLAMALSMIGWLWATGIRRDSSPHNPRPRAARVTHATRTPAKRKASR